MNATAFSSGRRFFILELNSDNPAPFPEILRDHWMQQRGNACGSLCAYQY